MAKKRVNKPDLTSRNLGGLKKRLDRLEKIVDELVDSHKVNNPHFYRHLVRVKNG